MTFRTGQIYTSRVFSTDLALIATDADIEAARSAVEKIAEGFVQTALADLEVQTGKTIELPTSKAIFEYIDGAYTRVACDVNFDNWPDAVLFGQSVWDYCTINGIEVDD